MVVFLLYKPFWVLEQTLLVHWRYNNLYAYLVDCSFRRVVFGPSNGLYLEI